MPVLRAVLNDILSNKMIIKVVHDCKMDCDALYHLQRVTLNEVFDTSAMATYIDKAVNHREGSRYSLNDTFAKYKLPIIACREGPT